MNKTLFFFNKQLFEAENFFIFRTQKNSINIFSSFMIIFLKTLF